MSIGSFWYQVRTAHVCVQHLRKTTILKLSILEKGYNFIRQTSPTTNSWVQHNFRVLQQQQLWSLNCPFSHLILLERFRRFPSWSYYWVFSTCNALGSSNLLQSIARKCRIRKALFFSLSIISHVLVQKDVGFHWKGTSFFVGRAHAFLPTLRILQHFSCRWENEIDGGNKIKQVRSAKCRTCSQYSQNLFLKCNVHALNLRQLITPFQYHVFTHARTSSINSFHQLYVIHMQYLISAYRILLKPITLHAVFMYWIAMYVYPTFYSNQSVLLLRWIYFFCKDWIAVFRVNWSLIFQKMLLLWIKPH